MSRSPIGRANPPNRFEHMHVAPAPELGFAPAPDDPPEDPRTELLVDPSRTVVATNDSPDVGFDASVNPYRGCQHACSYCLAPETSVLRADLTSAPIGELKIGDELVGFDEFPASGQLPRKLRRSVVQQLWRLRLPTTRVVTEIAEVTTTAQHRWLRCQSDGWSSTRQLSVGQALRCLQLPSSAGFAGRELASVSQPATIEAIERGPTREVVDIQTSTRTFFANGLATHNCYARPSHEYLGYSAGLDFQTKILVKPRAAELLRKQLMSPSWKPRVVMLSGVTDCYQPAERRLRITRACLEVLAEFRNPVGIVTKGFLVTRDVDLLAELASVNAASVMLSITTLDAELQRKMEPLASPPSKRLAALEALAKAGVPVGVMAAPVVPGLTDHELPSILQAAADAGAGSAGFVVLRLPHGVKELFSDWLAQHYPERREKVLNRLRALHGGALYDSRFAHRQRGSGEFAAQIQALFELGMKRAGLARRGAELSTAAFRRPGEADQLSLFSS
jgi:DNA repair photolyase